MGEPMEIEVFLPQRANEANLIDHALIAITEAIYQIDANKVAFGILGGQFGYGAHFDNEVFTMRPYCWADCDCGSEGREEEFYNKNQHTYECYYAELTREKKEKGIHWRQESAFSYDEKREIETEIYKRLCKKHGLTYPGGCAVHCNCGLQELALKSNLGHTASCCLELPNFLHKATGAEIRWYKWIGRGMETKIPDGTDMQKMFSECMDSMKTNHQTKRKR